MNNENNIDIISDNITTETKDINDANENLNIIEDINNDNYLTHNIKISDLDNDIEVVDEVSNKLDEEVPLIDVISNDIEVISDENNEEIHLENTEMEVISTEEILDESANLESSTETEIINENEVEQEINISNDNIENTDSNEIDSQTEEIKVNETVNNIETTKETDNYCGNKESFDIISKYGENFSTKDYLTNPAIGRDNEIKQLIVTLLTPEKSGILVGKPGIGKTAIVEGLGYRIKIGDVPNALKGYTIFKLNTASLTGNMPGTNELKIQFIVDHLKNLDKIMIFIDEIHTLIGDGENTLDFANIFKPIIDRGTIKIIGATTSDEYDRYILKDKAFVRRFQKIEVSEPDREMAIEIMMGTYPKFEKKMGLKLKYTDFIKRNIMAFIVDSTSEFKRVYETSVRYPDISLTILQQAFSYASFDNREEVSIRDIRKAIQTTKLIYPDVIKKELVRFNTVFKDVYLMETKQILKDEV